MCLKCIIRSILSKLRSSDELSFTFDFQSNCASSAWGISSSFPGGKVLGGGGGGDRSSPSSAEAKKVWRCTPTTPACHHGVYKGSFICLTFFVLLT